MWINCQILLTFENLYLLQGVEQKYHNKCQFDSYQEKSFSSNQHGGKQFNSASLCQGQIRHPGALLEKEELFFFWQFPKREEIKQA